MAISKWIYRKADGVFTVGGYYEPRFDPLLEGVVEFQDADPHPDIRTQRFDPAKGKRDATPVELQAFDDSQSDEKAKGELDTREIKAAIIAVFWQITGARPTPVQLIALRTKFVTVYKELL